MQRILPLALLLQACAAQPPDRAGCELAEGAIRAMQLQPVAGLYARAAGGNSCLGAVHLLTDWGWWPAAQLAHINTRVSDWLDPREQYLGFSDDPWLGERLQHRLNNPGDLNADPGLRQWLDQQVDAGRASGYNLYRRADLPHFDPARSLFYGHSHPVHLRQLIALLHQQKLIAKIQLVPKRSVFVFLPEWGNATTQLATTASGKHLARPAEYDLYLEFSSANGRADFLAIIERYAKRNSDSSNSDNNSDSNNSDSAGTYTASPGTDLLTASWWQPFIGTATAATTFQPLTQHMYSGSALEARVILPGPATHLPPPPPGVQHQQTPLWVNPAFYRYISGQGFE
jgi:hypothetical protein